MSDAKKALKANPYLEQKSADIPGFCLFLSSENDKRDLTSEFGFHSSINGVE